METHYIDVAQDKIQPGLLAMHGCTGDPLPSGLIRVRGTQVQLEDLSRVFGHPYAILPLPPADHQPGQRHP